MDASFNKAATAYQDNLRLMQGIKPQPMMEQETKPHAFADMLSDALGGAVDTGLKAEKLQIQAMTGQADLAELATAIAEAELVVNTVVAVRDRAVAAYQEISRMPL